MITVAKILKTLTAGTLALAILTGATISSCTQKKSESTETEEATGGEHPTDGESEHPTEGGEHPASDTTATNSEHPAGAEHPTEEK